MIRRILLPTILAILTYGFWISPDFKEIAAGVAIFLFGMLAMEQGFQAFTGGTLENPTYNGNHQGHYEAVEITYDPQVVSYQNLLDHYWVNTDPFDPTGQFCDKGHSYLAAIFVSTPEERHLAEESKQQVIDMFPGQKVVTPVLDASVFYPIAGDESYHQDYYKNNSLRYKFYRTACGRDTRLRSIWGDRVTH